MSFERDLRRYSAYFRGWCQAFGEYDGEFKEENGTTWLLGTEQIGLILPERMRRKVYKDVLAKKARSSLLTVSNSYFQLDDARFSVSGNENHERMEALVRAFKDSEALHLYLTYHLLYPSARFVTLSKNAPLRIIYKEIEPMRMRIV